MVSPVFFVKNGVFFRKTVPVFAVLCFCFGTLLFSGCTQPAQESGNLAGTWTNVSGGYTTTITITSDTVTYAESYEAAIVNKPDFEAANGVLIIKFTQYADYRSDLSTSHANVGKYGALYWKELTASSVSIADAYKKVNAADEYPSHTMFDTLAEAQGAFTIGKVAEYIDWSITSPYAK
jgi:hypothetical protein